MYAFAMQHHLKSPDGSVLAPSDETHGIIHHFSRTAEEWTQDWPSEMRTQLEAFFDMEPLVKLRLNNKYICQDSCFELAQQCTLYDPDAEQRQLYQILKSLSQEAYRDAAHQYKDSLKEPLPLHLISKLEEYIT